MRRAAAVAALLFSATGPQIASAQQLRGETGRQLQQGHAPAPDHGHAPAPSGHAPAPSTHSSHASSSSSHSGSGLAKCEEAPYKIERIMYERAVEDSPNMFGWSIEPHGWTAFNADCWHHSFPMCGGMKQSPVRFKVAGHHRRLQAGHEDHGHETHGTTHAEDSHAAPAPAHGEDHGAPAPAHGEDHGTGHSAPAPEHGADHGADHAAPAPAHGEDHGTDHPAPAPEHGADHGADHATPAPHPTDHGTGHPAPHPTTAAGHGVDHGTEDHSAPAPAHGTGHGYGGSARLWPDSSMAWVATTRETVDLVIDRYFKSVRASSNSFGTMVVDGIKYTAKYVHLFADGLHEMEVPDGSSSKIESFDAEAFIVFFPDDTSTTAAWSPALESPLVIVSVLIKEAQKDQMANSALFRAFGLDHASWKKEWTSSERLLDLMPSALGGFYLTYDGSLPVPPCWEGVRYYVMETPELISREELLILREQLNADQNMYRPTTRGIYPTSDPAKVEPTGSCPELIKAKGDQVSQICWPYLEQSKHGTVIESPISMSEGASLQSSAEVPAHQKPKMKYKRLLASSQRGPYSLQVLPAKGHNFGSLELDGRFYTAVSISVHAMGQHIIDGVRYDGEIHIQHELYGDWFSAGSHHPNWEHGRRLDAFRGNSRNTSDMDAAGAPSNLLIVVVPLRLTTQPPSELLSFLLPHSIGTFERDYASHEDLKAIFASEKFYQYTGSAMHPPFVHTREIYHYIVYSTPLNVNKEQLYTEAPTMSSFDSTALVKSFSRPVYRNFVPPKSMGTGRQCRSIGQNMWTYADEYCWGEMGPEHDATSFYYPDCSKQSQSPINIITSELVDSGEKASFLSHVKYHPVSGLVAYNTGHSIEADDRMNGDTHLGMGYLQIHGDYYFVQQVNVHFPSEHVVDGKVYTGELQVVHQRQKKWGGNWYDDILVVAIFFEIGEPSTLLEQLYLDGHGTAPLPKKMKYPFDLARHIGPVLDGDWFRYKGSFTTPPCSEVVKWYVFKNTLTCSLEQFHQFKAIQGFSNPANARAVQLMHGRKVALNSFEAPGDPKPEIDDWEFHINRDTGRTRLVSFPRSPWLIMWAVVGIAILATLTMIASFVREDPIRKAESAGGLSADPIGRNRYDRL